MLSGNLRTGCQKISWKESYEKWVVERVNYLHWREYKKLEVSGDWTQAWNEWQCRLRGKTACQNIWPRPIHPNYASILETDDKTNDKGLFLESIHLFLNKSSINEREPFPRVYASLVSSLRGNEHWRFCYIFAFRVSPRKTAEGGRKFSFKSFRFV